MVENDIQITDGLSKNDTEVTAIDNNEETFVFGSLEKCKDLCNITTLEWCPNIEVGLT